MKRARQSRLVQVLQEYVASEPQAWLTPCQFAILPEYGAVSADRPAGAGGPGLYARGGPRAEAQQAGGVPGAVWFAAGRGRAALCRPLPAAGHLCPLTGRPSSRSSRPCMPLTILLRIAAQQPVLLRHGRPALGRSDHAGLHPPGRRPYRPHPGALDLSTRLQLTLDGALAPDLVTQCACRAGGETG